MRILNAIHAQSVGGVDQMFYNYAATLAAEGHEVALLISDNGYDNYKIPNVKKIFRLKNYSQILDCFKLLLILLVYRPQLIICHSNRLMKWMRILHYFVPTKSIAVNHGIGFKNSLNCDYIININQQINDMVVKAGFDATKSFTLQNAINIDQEYHKKLIKKPLIIGMYGRIEPRKGFDILLQAGAILAEKNIDFRLKIGGFEVPGGYHWQYLQDFATQEKIYDKCDFVGLVSDKKDFFKDVDIFCVPSREEPFGLVILEGFLYSTLVISSDTIGGKFLIENKKSGLLFENGNPADLAKKITTINQGQEKHCDFTRMAYLKLTKQFSQNNFAQEIAKILQQIFK